MHFVQYMWTKLTVDQIIMRPDNHQIPIGDIPFPVVSICPITKTAVNKFNYTDVYRAMLDGNSSRIVTPEEYDSLNSHGNMLLDALNSISFQIENNEYSCSIV